VLVGFALLLVFGIHRTLIKAGILQPVSKAASDRNVRLLLHYGFVIAIVVIILGFGLQGFMQFVRSKQAGGVAISRTNPAPQTHDFPPPMVPNNNKDIADALRLSSTASEALLTIDDPGEFSYKGQHVLDESELSSSFEWALKFRARNIGSSPATDVHHDISCKWIDMGDKLSFSTPKFTDPPHAIPAHESIEITGTALQSKEFNPKLKENGFHCRVTVSYKTLGNKHQIQRCFYSNMGTPIGEDGDMTLQSCKSPTEF
jgi:hypothetical protein